jgi:hypothetical protein
MLTRMDWRADWFGDFDLAFPRCDVVVGSGVPVLLGFGGMEVAVSSNTTESPRDLRRQFRLSQAAVADSSC